MRPIGGVRRPRPSGGRQLSARSTYFRCPSNPLTIGTTCWWPGGRGPRPRRSRADSSRRRQCRSPRGCSGGANLRRRTIGRRITSGRRCVAVVSYRSGTTARTARGGRAFGRERQVSSRTGSAALAVGSCYHPEAEIPNRWSARARHRPRTRRSGCDRGRAARTDSAFLRVAVHSAESMRLLRELFELPHQQSRVDSVAHAVASMTEMNLANVDAAVKHVRQGSSAASY